MLLVFIGVSNDCIGQDSPRTTIEAYKSERLKQADELARLTPQDHEELWRRLIELQIRNSGESIKLDAFGMAATAIVDRQRPNMCSRLMEEVSEEIQGQEMSFKDLKGLLLNLKKRVDSEWGQVKSQEAQCVVFRAKLFKKHSRVRKRLETWLLIDVFGSEQSPHDLVKDDYQKKLREHRSAPRPVDSQPEAIVYKKPHPLFYESKFMWSNLPIPKSGRNQTVVKVADDGLTPSERESELGFRFTDTTGFESHQIEEYECELSSAKAPTMERVDYVIKEAGSLMADRLPKGAVVTPQELHLRLGSVVRILNRRFDDIELHVVAEQAKIGERFYSRLRIKASQRK